MTRIDYTDFDESEWPIDEIILVAAIGSTPLTPTIGT